MLDDQARKWNSGKEYVCLLTPTEIARRLGYKSGNSVRKELYELVDNGIILMHCYHGKGIVETVCYFCSKVANLPSQEDFSSINEEWK